MLWLLRCRIAQPLGESLLQGVGKQALNSHWILVKPWIQRDQCVSFPGETVGKLFTLVSLLGGVRCFWYTEHTTKTKENWSGFKNSFLPAQTVEKFAPLRNTWKRCRCLHCILGFSVFLASTDSSCRAYSSISKALGMWKEGIAYI